MEEAFRPVFQSVADAHGLYSIQYIENYSATAVSDAPALKFDVQVRYNNGDIVGGVFHERADAIAYLQKFL